MRWQRSLTDSNGDSETQLAARLRRSLAGLDPYVHARGLLRSATGLANENILRFSRESLSVFGARMMDATQVSIAVLLVAFLPTATSHPEAATWAGRWAMVGRERALLRVGGRKSSQPTRLRDSILRTDAFSVAPNAGDCEGPFR